MPTSAAAFNATDTKAVGGGKAAVINLTSGPVDPGDVNKSHFKIGQRL